MAQLTTAAIFVIMVNILMWFSAAAMKDIHPGLSNGLCFNVENSVIGANVQASGEDYVLKNNISQQLPSGEGTISPSSTLNFIDTFVNLLSWIKELPGFLLGIVTAPAVLLACTNLPTIFIVGIDVLWYLLSLLIIVEFIKGSG